MKVKLDKNSHKYIHGLLVQGIFCLVKLLTTKKTLADLKLISLKAF